MEGSAHFDSTVSVTLEVPPTTAPAPPPPSGPLPFTGTEVDTLLMIAAALVVAGLLILSILSIRRNRLEPSHA